MSCLLLISGCGGDPGYKGDPRATISGKVTLDGANVNGGSIVFRPQGHTGREASATISEGQYTILESQGPNAGKYSVEIRWIKDAGSSEGEVLDASQPAPKTTDAIPAKYNTQTELSENVKAGANTLNFDLKSN